MDEQSTELQGLEKPEGESAPQPAPVPQPAAPAAHKPSDYEQVVARAKRAEEALKEANKELDGLRVQKASDSAPQDWQREVAINRYMVQGYSETEAKALVSTNQSNLEFVKAGIEAQRAKSKVEQAQPGASQVAAPASQQGTPIHKLQPAERSKAWREALDRAAAKRGSGGNV